MKKRLLQFTNVLLLPLLFLLLMAMSFDGKAQTDATVKTDKADYLPGQRVTITGTNWLPGESVVLKIEHTVFTTHESEIITTIALDSKEIFDNSYIINPLDLGETFLLTATGQTSGKTASWIFTDGNNGPATLSNITLGSANGSVTYGTSGSISFTVSVSKSSDFNSETASLSISGLPAGVTANFVPTSLDFGSGSNKVSTINATLTISTNATTAKPVDNYSFTVTATGTNSRNASSAFTINKKALTISATGINKEYDGNTNATVTLSDNRVSGDAITLNYTSATFADKYPGTNKTVNVTGITVAGTNANYYT